LLSGERGPLGRSEVRQRLLALTVPIPVSTEARAYSLQELGLTLVLLALEVAPEVAKTFSPHV